MNDELRASLEQTIRGTHSLNASFSILRQSFFQENILLLVTQNQLF